MRLFFPRISGINFHLNEKHAFYSQTEQVEWCYPWLIAFGKPCFRKGLGNYCKTRVKLQFISRKRSDRLSASLTLQFGRLLLWQEITLNQWLSEDVRGPWTTNFPGPRPSIFFSLSSFSPLLSVSRDPFISGAPGHCPPMPPTRYATPQHSRCLPFTKKSYILRPFLANYVRRCLIACPIRHINLQGKTLSKKGDLYIALHASRRKYC